MTVGTETFFDNGVVQLYQADARAIPLPDQSIHCVVTSPPYFALRVYADNDDRGIGWGDTVDDYLADLVDVFREVWRVLRDDGVCWINMGDSMVTDWGSQRNEGRNNPDDETRSRHKNPQGVQGNRLGVPERLVLALQADGWIWRDTVIWAKKTAKPESVNGWRWERCRVKVQSAYRGGNGNSRMLAEGSADHEIFRAHEQTEWSDCPGCPKCEANDGLVLRKGSWRTTSSHEYIFMLTKATGYFCDAEAVKTAARDWGPRDRTGNKTHSGGTGLQPHAGLENTDTGTANRRSVWNDISPEPYPGPHFATFPSGLPRICIQASTSEKGVCASCGRQWARVIERPSGGTTGASWHDHQDDMENGNRTNKYGKGDGYISASTVGWRATCDCDADVIPATVLDPFAGTFTTGLAAQKLGRRSVGTDISEDYLSQAVKRLTAVPLPLI